MELKDKITELFNECGDKIFYRRQGFFLSPKRTYLCFNNVSGVAELSLITSQRTGKMRETSEKTVTLDDLLANPEAPENSKFVSAVNHLYASRCEFRPITCF